MRRSLRHLLLCATATVLVAGCAEDADETLDDGDPADLVDATLHDASVDDTPDAADDTPDAALPDAELPPDAAPPPGEPTGGACAADDACRSQVCLAAPTFPAGLCTELNCMVRGCADPTDRCIEGFGTSYCIAACEGDADCRPAYSCRELEGTDTTACVPTLAATDRPDGSPCIESRQCAGGLCLRSWPEGFCTTFNCQTSEDCNGTDGEQLGCVPFFHGRTFCIETCEVPADCRPGYICESFDGSGEGACFPNPTSPIADLSQLADLPFDVQCGPASGGMTYRLPFEVSEDATSYMFVPISPNGERIEAQYIETPNGLIDFNGFNHFQAIPGRIFGTNPTVVPATAAFSDQLVPGPHTYVLESEGAEICSYLVEEKSAGSRVDLNVYLVGLPDVTVANAAEHEALQEALDQFRSVYEAVGIVLGTVRYLELDAETTERLRIVRSTDDVSALLEATEPPGDTPDALLSINVVFAAEFAMRGGTIGISEGLPGPAGLHGTRVSGVVFTAEYLGRRFENGTGQLVDGSPYTGNVLAHEVGHYLGLFHTTETDAASVDPLPDTPECRSEYFPNACPDITNLMFPLATRDNGVLTTGQGAVILANPLTKE